jgi:hypothetical protein
VPIWLFEAPQLVTAIVMVVFVETLSLIGLFIARRFLLPRFHYSEGIHDAISGTVQAIGVFYGVTVGLIAVAVWNTSATATDLVSNEASAIGGLMRDVRGLPSPMRENLSEKLREYTAFVIEQDWPAQERGRILDGGTKILNEFQEELFSYEPHTSAQTELFGEALRGFDKLSETRRLRLLAVNGALSDTMWAVIWIGAVISIGVAYLFNIEDPKMHAALVALMGGFLAIVLFMIVINDKPFYGNARITAQPYQLLLDKFATLTK